MLLSKDTLFKSQVNENQKNMGSTSAMDFPDEKNINENDYKKQYEEILAKVDEQEKILVFDIKSKYLNF